MKCPNNLLQLAALVLALCHMPAVAAGAGYGFEPAKAYLEARSRDMTDFQNRLENDLFQSLDDANAINIKYKTSPPDYVLYRLNLAKEIEGSGKKPEKLTALCKNFIFINTAEKDYNAKIQAFNESIADKFIQRELYQLMDDDALREVLVNYIATYNMIYGFKKPELLKTRIEKSVPYKAEDGSLGVLYAVNIIDGEEASGAAAISGTNTGANSGENAVTGSVGGSETDHAAEETAGKLYLAAYHNGEIVNLEQATDDAADLAVLKLCSKVQ